MYRLLIVTDDADALKRLSAMTNWETLGFRPPRLRNSVEGAIECLQQNIVDAIAVEESPAFDRLMLYLNEHYPQLPVFDITPTEDEQRAVMREVYNLLKRILADDSNDELDQGYMFRQLRERWLRKVVAGLIPTQEEIRRSLRLYRCRARMGVPCVLARLELPQDDPFFSERWHYGSERLETALSNFFGTEHDHMLVHVAVISPQEARVLYYPADEEANMTENAVLSCVQEAVEQVDHYVGLRMRVLDAQRLSGIGDFASGRTAK